MQSCSISRTDLVADNEQQQQQITHETGDGTSSIVAMVSRIYGGSIAVSQWLLSLIPTGLMNADGIQRSYAFTSMENGYMNE
jgi:hypothetical protein